MDFRFGWKSGLAADITAMTEFDPQPTKAPSKSRSAVGLPQCYLPLRSTGEIAGETARVHHAARRRGGCVAGSGGRAAADWSNGQDATHRHLDARARRAFRRHSRTILPWVTRTRLHRRTEPSHRAAKRGLETGSVPRAGD